MNRSVTAHWNRFFFAPADPRLYAAIRIAVATMLAIHLAVLAPDWIRWFGDSGTLDRASARANIDSDCWSLFFWLDGTPAVLWTCFAIFSLQVVCLGVGLATRFQSVCVFLWLVSLHNRNNLIWDGGDVLLRIVCFLLIFMPAGLVWSLDARRRRKQNTATPPATLWPVRLLQIELTLLYLSSVLRKLSGGSWPDGSALHYALRLDEFSGHRLPVGEMIGDFFPLLQFLTWLALSIEILLAFGVWVPSLRRSTVFIGLGFHLALELTMNLFVFQWLMIGILATHLFTPLPGAPDTNEKAL